MGPEVEKQEIGCDWVVKGHWWFCRVCERYSAFCPSYDKQPSCPGRKEKPMRHHTWVMNKASGVQCENCGAEITPDKVKEGVPIGPCELKPEIQEAVNSCLEKSPVGLRPLALVVDDRIQEILAACTRYAEAGKTIPEEWITELDRLNKARSLK